MVRIISGAPEDTNVALMQGLQMGRQFARPGEEQKENERAQLRSMLELHKAKASLEKERAKALADANERAAMGDVNAWKQQEMERMLQNLPPNKKRLVDGLQLRQKLLTDGASEDAVKMFDTTFQQVEAEIQTQERKQAAEAEIARAAKDGLIDEQGVVGYQQALQSGEEPETIINGFNDARAKNAFAAANMKENASAMEEARAAIDAAPPGPDKKRAEILFAEWEQSPSLQEQEGEGPQRFAAIQRELVKSREDQVARYVSDRKDEDFLKNLSMAIQEQGGQFGEQEFGGGIGGRLSEAFGKGGPPDQEKTGAMKAHIEKQRAEKEKRYPGSATTRAAAGLPKMKIKRAKTNQEITKILQDAGIPLTHEVAAEVQNIRGGRER